MIGRSSAPAGFTLNHGRYFDTGSSSRSLPCSRSCMIAVAVNSLLCDAMRNFVAASSASLRGVGMAEARRPDQLLVGDHAHGNARQAAVSELALDPGGEQANRRLHVGIGPSRAPPA